MTKLEQLNKAREEYKNLMKSTGKQIINELTQTFFTTHPEVNSIRWRQYTPYFNDGDSCVFGLHGVYLNLNESSLSDEAEEYGGDYDDGFLSSYDKKVKGTLKTDFQSLEDTLEENQDLLEEVFGDHMKVTVHRNGTVDIEEYEHD